MAFAQEEIFNFDLVTYLLQTSCSDCIEKLINPLKNMKNLDLSEETMKIYTMKKGHQYWDKTIEFASKCSWTAGQFLAERMTNNEFLDWERVMAVVDDDKIVGFAVFSEKDGLPKEYDQTPYISLVFVDEAYRGERLSQKLIQHTINYAKGLKYKIIYLKSEHRGLYEKYGFEKIAEFVPVEPPADQLFKMDII